MHGKTHTMLGTPDSPEVIARTVSSLFDRLIELKEQNGDIKYTVSGMVQNITLLAIFVLFLK